MELINNIPNNNKKVSKIKLWFIIVIVLIIILLLTAGGVWIYMQNLASNQFKFYIDGNKQTEYSDSLFLYENNKVYLSIKELAPLLGYRVYNGGYGQYTEDTTKCYINNLKEVSSFESNSTKLYKYNVLDANSESQTFNLTEVIKPVGNNLYISSEDVTRAFNVSFTRDESKNSISIYTLNYLTDYYSKQIANSAITKDTSQFSESVLYNNQKAILYNMMVVKDSETKLYGMVMMDEVNNPIIGMRYSSIEFIEGSNDFIVKTSDSNAKVGIIGNDGMTKVRLEYDDIKEIDKNLGLYLVTSNNKQGVVNKNGKIIVYQDYDKIGLENTIKDNNVTNKYILFDNCIPVQRNKLWGLIDINGNEILSLQYDGLGCKADTSKDTRYSDVIIIPEIDGIVVEKDEVNGTSKIKKYGVVKSDGSDFINIVIDSIYSLTSQGETIYYASVQNQIIDLVDFVYQQQAVGANEQTSNARNNIANTTTNTTANTISNETNNTVTNTIENDIVNMTANNITTDINL